MLITGPNGFSRAAQLVTTALANGTPISPTYRIDGEGGAFSAGDSGTYTVTLVGGQVADAFGNAVAGAVPGTFVVAIIPPTAVIVSGAPVTDIGTAFSTVAVRFSDDSGIDRASVSRNDLVRVTGPDGQARFATFFDLTGEGEVVTARCRFGAIGSAFVQADSGSYAIAVVGGIAADTDGNTFASTVASAGVALAIGVLDRGPDLTAAITTALPARALGGDRRAQKVNVLVRNVGGVAVSRFNTVVSLYLSSDDALDTTVDWKVAQTTIRALSLKAAAPGARPAGRTAALRFTNPNDIDGNFRLIARVDDAGALAETREGNNTAVGASTVELRRPFVDLSGTLNAASFVTGRRPRASIVGTLINSGNVTPTERLPSVKAVTLRLTAVPVGGADAIQLGEVTVRFGGSFKSGGATQLRLSLRSLPTALVAGAYTLNILIDPTNQVNDQNAANNVLSAGLTVV